MFRGRKHSRPLAGVAQWIECQPANQRVTSSIPSQGTCLGCRAGSQWGLVRGNHTLMFLSLSPSLPLSLKINLFKKHIKGSLSEWQSSPSAPLSVHLLSIMGKLIKNANSHLHPTCTPSTAINALRFWGGEWALFFFFYLISIVFFPLLFSPFVKSVVETFHLF